MEDVSVTEAAGTDVEDDFEMIGFGALALTGSAATA